MATDSSDDRNIPEEQRTDISVLASAVISVLSDKDEEDTQTIRKNIVQTIVESTLRDGSFNAEYLLNELRDSRLSPDQIVDIYIPLAAREMGQMWVEDIIGFAKVTIATARLQGLLTLLAPPWSAKPVDVATGINVLLVLGGNDSHTLGPHVATAQLRRMGASVRILFGASTDTIMRTLSEETYDMVMFSASRTDALASVEKTVKRIKSSFISAPPVVLGGLVLNLTDRVKEKTGVDLVTNDVKVAYKLCEKNRARNKSPAGR